MNTGKLKHQYTLLGHEESIGGAIPLSLGSILSWSDDTTIRIWSLEDSTQTRILRGHEAQVTHALSLPEDLITSTAYDGSLCVWESKAGVLERKIIRTESSFMGTAYWCHNQVVSWDLEGNLISWNISTGEEISVLEGACFGYHNTSMSCPFLLLKEQGLAVTWPSITLEFWDLQTGHCVNSFMEHEDGPEAASLLPDGRILSWSNDRTLKIWTPEGVVEATLEGHKNTVRNAFSLDNDNVVSWSSDSTIRIWDISLAQSKCVFAQHNSLILNVWRVSTRLLLSRSLDGCFHVWDRFTGENIVTFNTSITEGIVISTSRFLSWAGKTLQLWALDSGECVQTINGHDGEILGAIVIDSGTVVTWSKDATLKVWELEG